MHRLATAVAIVSVVWTVATSEQIESTREYLREEVSPRRTNDAPEHSSRLGGGAVVPSKTDLAKIDDDVSKKLKAMQDLLHGIHSGVDRSMRARARAMESKISKLTVVIAELSKQKDSLYKQNSKMKTEIRSTMKKLETVEAQLKLEAKRAHDNDLRTWLNEKAGEISQILTNSGLQNFKDPNFSPLVAGAVTYGVVLLPMVVGSGFVAKHVKHLSPTHALMAIHLFEGSFCFTTALSTVLLVTADPWRGMQHISSANFAFLQILVAGLYWTSITLTVVVLFQVTAARHRAVIVLQIALRATLGYYYGQKVWIDAVQKNSEEFHVIPSTYVLISLGVLLSYLLTSLHFKQAKIEVAYQDKVCQINNPRTLQRITVQQNEKPFGVAEETPIPFENQKLL